MDHRNSKSEKSPQAVELLKMHRPWLLRRAAKLCAGIGGLEAEDLVQEALLRFLMESSNHERPLTEMEKAQWLATVLGYVFISSLQRRRMEVLEAELHLVLTDQEGWPFHSTPGPFFKEPTDREFDSFLAQLGPGLGLVLVTSFPARSYGETAKLLGIKWSDVAERLLNARRQLQRFVGPEPSVAEWEWIKVNPCTSLGSFFDGELAIPEAETIRMHLARCERCQLGLLALLQLDGFWACLADRFLGSERPLGHRAVNPGAATFVALLQAFRTRIKKLRVLRDESQAVRLGASVPRSVRPGEQFTVRFAAYRRSLTSSAKRQLRMAGAKVASRLDLATVLWRVGTLIEVRLSGEHFETPPTSKRFVWEGHEHYLDFDVRFGEDSPSCKSLLNLDIIVSGFILTRIRLALSIRRSKGSPWSGRRSLAFTNAPQTAFASYAAEDRLRVLDRIASVRIAAGIDIFMDCHSLNPNEKWRDRLEKEIAVRDVFMLFWSEGAAQSRWVEWEWRYALRRKGLDAFQAHPLDPWPKAPLPPELAELHFGDPLMAVRAALAPSSAHDRTER